ncbi:hypothetical protein GQ457_16G022020 [Hibiscus cannabinus]
MKDTKLGVLQPRFPHSGLGQVYRRVTKVLRAPPLTSGGAPPWSVVGIDIQTHGLTQFALLKPNINSVLPKNVSINKNLVRTE